MEAAPLGWFLISVLGVFRLSHLIAAEDGPWDLLARLRMAGSRFGRLVDCPYCVSLWVAIPFSAVLGSNGAERALLWLGLSGGAVFLDRLTHRTEPPLTAPYIEGAEENDHVMLRE
jgi:hypothetical protein